MGRPAYFDQSTHLVLVAGGIGITPMYSILSEIYARATAGHPIGNIQKVVLVWTARQPALFHQFSTMLMYAAKLDFVEVQLNYTSNAEYGAIDSEDPASAEQLREFISQCMRIGRPDLHRVADRLPRGRTTMMMVCGPEKLINFASDVAFDNNFSFHHEVFHF